MEGDGGKEAGRKGGEKRTRKGRNGEEAGKKGGKSRGGKGKLRRKGSDLGAHIFTVSEPLISTIGLLQPLQPEMISRQPGSLSKSQWTKQAHEYLCSAVYPCATL